MVSNPLRVAYLGPEGTFTHQAAKTYFTHPVEFQAFRTINDIFNAISTDNVEYGVLPVENSTEGAVTHTLDCFMDFDVFICGEIELKIVHHLLVKDLNAEIDTIISHPMALAQCKKYLNRYYPDVVYKEATSTAQAASIATQESNVAAIAGDIAKEHFGLLVKAEQINDKKHNFTRFLIIGKNEPLQSEENKTSLMLAYGNKPGTLVNLLMPFSDFGVGLTKIESRPCPDNIWHYVFFVDCEGHIKDNNIAMVLKVLKDIGVKVKVLGSYPVGCKRA